MKSLKKIMALVIAMVMVLGMSTMAMADQTDVTGKQTLTISNPVSGHTYEAYQIFTGDLSYDSTKDANETSSYTMSNIAWGNGVTDAAKAAYASAFDANGHYVETFLADSAAARSFADGLVAGSGSTAYLQNAIGITSGTTQVDPGYYLIKDVTNSEGTVSDTAGGEQTAYVVQVVKPTTITLKVGTTESDKKVADINDSTATVVDAWGDSSDYDLNDDVPFRLSATLPANVLDFKKYHMTFHDEQSAGLSFNSGSVKVFVGETEVGEGFALNDSHKATNDTFSVHIADVTALKDKSGNAITVAGGTKIYVTYTSKLTGTSVVYGNSGNPNMSYVTYSNNPNVDEDGEHGRTPDDTVWVFTFKTEIDKVDENGNALTGAEFELKKFNKEGSTWTTITKVTGTAGSLFQFTGLDDGVYSIEETETPDGYNTLDPSKFYINVEVTHTDSDESVADTISSFTVTPYKTFVESTGALSDELTTISFTTNAGSGEATKTVKDSKGADTQNTVTLESGEANAVIINNKGTVLPSTGGMGTTLFYVIGAILVLGAGILLVSKRRMSAN